MQNIALIGSAHIHMPGIMETLKNHKDINISAVWDHDIERGKRYADILKVPFVGELSALLADETISSVVIASETYLHEELVITVTNAKKNLFVEKPLGINAADSARMLKAINESGVIFQTGYFHRSSPVYIFIKEQIEKGNFGKITRIRHTNCHHGALAGWFDTEWRWMTDLNIAGVGAFGDLGTHSLDIILWLMGYEEITSVTGNLDVGIDRYNGCDEFGEAMLKFKNGAIATIAAGWVDVANPCNLIVNGTKGAAWLSDDGLHFKSELIPDADGRLITDLPAPLPKSLDLFLDAINDNNRKKLVTITEAAICSSVMNAIYIAAKINSWVVPEKI